MCLVREEGICGAVVPRERHADVGSQWGGQRNLCRWQSVLVHKGIMSARVCIFTYGAVAQC